MRHEKNEEIHSKDEFYEGLLPSYEKQETEKIPSYKDVVDEKNVQKRRRKNKATRL